MIKQVVAVCVCTYFAVSIAEAENCDARETLALFKKPMFEFNTRLLDRLAYEEDYHFVFSPILTWLRLLALIEEAENQMKTILLQNARLKGKAIKHCYRRKFREIFNSIQYNVAELGTEWSGLVIIDKKFKSSKGFRTDVDISADTRFMSLDFKNKEDSATQAADMFQELISWDFNNIDIEDFRKPGIVISDITYFKSAWKHSFDEARNSKEVFVTLNESLKLEVTMMRQRNYFNYARMPLQFRGATINVEVLELPYLDERMSMLIFLPENQEFIPELFHALENYDLNGILTHLARQPKSLVEVVLPKFVTLTEVSNLLELLADLLGTGKGLNELPLYSEDGRPVGVSLITQLAFLEVNEKHDQDVITQDVDEEDYTEFNANRPFGYMVVHKETNAMLFAGLYSNPGRVVEDEIELEIDPEEG